jgi:GrpB-like predicted nucleotidyltransferase (UPF0157 family)
MKYITAYNQDWPERFAQISKHVRAFLPDDCTIHHIGSTSVPGMSGKDIIDLDIEYTQCTLQSVIDALREAGYKHEGDLGIPGREAFKPVPNSHAASLPAHHLYACENGAFELQKHLSFRDYLKSHTERADWLSKKKLSADASANTRDEYIENKSRYYEVITEESMEWANKSLQRTRTSRVSDL